MPNADINKRPQDFQEGIFSTTPGKIKVWKSDSASVTMDFSAVTTNVTITYSATGEPTFVELDVNGNIDQDVALTAAGDAFNSATTINHASAAVEGIDLTVAQLTTARTSGTVDGIKVSLTSLAGDSGGTYNDLELNCTDGGGSATHQAIKVGAGFDVLMDLSSCATGEADILLSDNKASALQIREGANVYMTFITSDSSEVVQVEKTLDLNATFDHDVALTAAGDGLNTALTINHATGNVEVIDASLSAITTARTGGTGIVSKAAIVGLAGDTSGTTYVGYDFSFTGNGGSAVVSAFRANGGHSILFDVSGASTGQNVVKVPANAAVAWQVSDGTNTFYNTVSTTGSLSNAFLQRITTTDGVASGTVRVVGGRAYSNTAAGSALTGSTSETVLGSYSIPANTLKSGSVLKFRAKIKVTADNGATELTPRVRLGATTLIGTALITGTATNTSANNIAFYEGELICRADPGAAVAIEGYGTFKELAAAGSGTIKDWSLDATNFATNGALLLEVTGQWNASDANSVQLEHLTVEIA